MLTFFLLDMRSVSLSSDCGLRLRELAELELLELLERDLDRELPDLDRDLRDESFVLFFFLRPSSALSSTPDPEAEAAASLSFRSLGRQFSREILA